MRLLKPPQLQNLLQVRVQANLRADSATADWRQPQPRWSQRHSPRHWKLSILKLLTLCIWNGYCSDRIVLIYSPHVKASLFNSFNLFSANRVFYFIENLRFFTFSFRHVAIQAFCFNITWSLRRGKFLPKVKFFP